MSLTLYHRTSIADARAIVQNGFENQKWRFEHDEPEMEEVKKAVGVWVSDRPLDQNEGPPGAAVVEVTLDVSEDALELFQFEGVLWDARLWVIPAEIINARANVRILNVDPRSSWFHEAPQIDDEDDG